ncbi:MAG: hypothetical protein K2X81_01295, partial [Candidatus Obscuribacterales bacterium]|nr:hypothetical protein [Candidatus Obscuribacterales bacterium]
AERAYLQAVWLECKMAKDNKKSFPFQQAETLAQILYKKAWDMNHPKASYRLARLLQDVKHSRAIQALLYKDAIVKSNPRAFAELGVASPASEDIVGLLKLNQSQRYSYILKAAELNDYRALLKLSRSLALRDEQELPDTRIKNISALKNACIAPRCATVTIGRDPLY